MTDPPLDVMGREVVPVYVWTRGGAIDPTPFLRRADRGPDPILGRARQMNAAASRHNMAAAPYWGTCHCGAEVRRLRAPDAQMTLDVAPVAQQHPAARPDERYALSTREPLTDTNTTTKETSMNTDDGQSRARTGDLSLVREVKERESSAESGQEQGGRGSTTTAIGPDRSPDVRAEYARPADGLEPGAGSLMSGYEKVAGRCPACQSSSLFLGDGGHVTCAILSCDDPSAADRLLNPGVIPTRFVGQPMTEYAQPLSDAERKGFDDAAERMERGRGLPGAMKSSEPALSPEEPNQ